MIFAFARDGGFPAQLAASGQPDAPHAVHAIWIGAVLAFISTLYTPQFWTLASGCAIFLYLSYAAPIGAGMLAEGKTWTKKGPLQPRRPVQALRYHLRPGWLAAVLHRRAAAQ
jgi:hypothetical protein